MNIPIWINGYTGAYGHTDDLKVLIISDVEAAHLDNMTHKERIELGANKGRTLTLIDDELRATRD